MICLREAFTRSSWRLAITRRGKARVGAEHDEAIAVGNMAFNRGKVAGGKSVSFRVIEDHDLVTFWCRRGFGRSDRDVEALALEKLLQVPARAPVTVDQQHFGFGANGNPC